MDETQRQWECGDMVVVHGVMCAVEHVHKGARRPYELVETDPPIVDGKVAVSRRFRVDAREMERALEAMDAKLVAALYQDVNGLPMPDHPSIPRPAEELPVVPLEEPIELPQPVYLTRAEFDTLMRWVREPHITTVTSLLGAIRELTEEIRADRAERRGTK